MEEKKIYTINMPINTEIQLLCKVKSKGSINKIYMAPITEEQEVLIRKSCEINIEVNNNVYKVNPNRVWCFGKIDLTDKHDIDGIESFDWFDDTVNGVYIPSDYDYNTHTCSSPLPQYRFYETWHNINIVRYKHACLGKPERIVIFSRFDKWKD